jgi:Putative Flp pilus-assembly TadE/G-like
VFRTAFYIKSALARFARKDDRSIAAIFALAIIPILLGVGAAMDFSRANGYRTALQAALDTAILAGAKDGSSNWANVAQRTFSGIFQVSYGTVSTPSFQQSESATYTGSVSATVPTTFMSIMHLTSLSVSVSAAATVAGPDNSCILTLDHGQPSSHVSLALNGAPIVNLSGCSIRSNTSLDCNGHDGNNTGALAAGVVSDCTHPVGNSSVVPDIYGSLASNITTQCSQRPGVTWSAGATPGGSGVITVDKGTYKEYHICGDLTVSGSGYLTGSSPTSDSVIVIENGSLNVANNANVSASRTGIVLTGNNTYASAINFPTGNGQNASLSLSAPTDASNPWQGVALYQDPKLTYQVDNRWGPGANFSADGLVYIGNSNVVTDGNTGSNNSPCSKFVMNSFTTNGHVDLDLQQQVTACSAIGLKQWAGVVVHLIR